MEVVLDTSFILTCLKEKIDFFQAEEYGKLLLPRQVILELGDLTSKGKIADRERAKLALELINKNKDKFKIIVLDRKYVDAGIRRYIKSNEKKFILATMDKELKRYSKNKVRILTIMGKKRIILA